jgi:hypothetical protein
MAIIGLGENAYSQFKAVLAKSARTATKGSQRRRQTPVIGGGGSGSGGGDIDGGKGTGGCCCDELACLRIPGLPDDVELLPEYYEITIPTLSCGCVLPDGVEDATGGIVVKFYPTDDPDIWEQKHGEDDDLWYCVGSDSEDCTATTTWTWTSGAWVAGDVDTTCSCTPDEPEFDGTTEGQTTDTTCDGSTLQLAFWRLTINETLDYFGCDSTKLEFIIGE